MKITRSLLRLAVLTLILLSVSVSCKKEDRDPEYSYFVSKELSYSYDTEYIKSILGTLPGSLPELTNLVPFIVSDIKIYKIIYKTTIKNEVIHASGLICVPTKPGEYPVISFQNGTNTLNANSPSQAPYNYQMIGLVASMGYVVVVADYPGFGASANIPHPYLVKEPMVGSMIDLLHAVNELPGTELPDLTIKNEYYVIGYSLGGWSSFALHKELETNHKNEFNLRGSVCGAGPYDIFLLLKNMMALETYHMPVYIGYILNAYTSYDQFSNPVSDILNEPYASRMSSLYNGVLGMSQINAQLTTSINELITPGFLSGFETASQFASVREALARNSISPWMTNTPLLLIHGSGDTQVDPVSTEDLYTKMIAAGTSPGLIDKIILPGDHGDVAVPAIIKGIIFIKQLSDQN